MRRPLIIALTIVVLIGVAPVGAHGNYVSADAQVSDDGTVRLELVVAVTDAFAVLRVDDDGRPGAVIGHRAVGDGFVHPSMGVRIDASDWANRTGNTTVWAVLHRDTGDGTFDPDDDPALETASGERVETRFTVRKSAVGKVNVAAERDHAQETNTSRVTIERVQLARPGYVVVRSNENGTAGRIVGRTRLEAGVHQDVPVAIDDAFYHDRPEEFDLWAAVHRSDGDGTFEPDADGPVTAGDDPVATRFGVTRTDEIETDTPGGNDGHEHDENGDNGADGDHEHDEGSHTPTPTPTKATPATTTEARTTTGTPTVASTPAPGQPGFGVAAAAAALVIVALAATRRSG